MVSYWSPSLSASIIKGLQCSSVPWGDFLTIHFIQQLKESACTYRLYSVFQFSCSLGVL